MLNEYVFSILRKTGTDSALVTSSVSEFQIRGARNTENTKRNNQFSSWYDEILSFGLAKELEHILSIVL